MIIKYLNKNDIESVKKIYSLYITRPEQLDHQIDYLNNFLNKETKAMKSDLRYLVAEDNKEIVGILGFRKALEDMIIFTKTARPVELYSLFVKTKKQGVGKNLIREMIKIIKQLKYTEIVVFSANKWKDGWQFYDKLGFKRIKTVDVPGEKPAQIWYMKIKPTS